MLLLLAIIYLAFISLGLPDSLLGSSWPIMSGDLNSNLEFAGVIAIVVSAGTVVSSLLSSRVTHHFGTGKVVAVSVLMTAIALYGFSYADNVWLLVLLAVPLGLGAGAVDAALNNFVALNYKAKHMNYLHSFWGVGATAGPLIMAMYLSQQQGWREGYTTISYIQFALVAVLLLALPLWKKAASEALRAGGEPQALISNSSALKIKGVKLQLLTFFCYCSLEAGTGLWAASYLITEKGVSASVAAFWTAMYFLGITLGRFFCGFIAERVAEDKLIRVGVITIFVGVVLLLAPISPLVSKLGLILIGLGCAPIYPNTIHLTPVRFGKQASQAIIGLSMACAYVGTTLMPPLIGVIAGSTSFIALPIALSIFSGVMLFSTERLKLWPKTNALQHAEVPVK
ncbi:MULTISPECIES: MFS transporter [unclassified Agarivorans]|uniref:MFS transporter n=1 Tax=unclassified Agarivorans TaxID=2636026 RepID=UPI0026E3E8A0|nr:MULTISPECIES: MFS transporter [unclassified Agarivorans]MDO6687092.1 MFS transporter [Agarivorans sp. 3_MG-2023]MDO6713496.1 MFS transporter [Agarivorans sp. 2_MG-2023]